MDERPELMAGQLAKQEGVFWRGVITFSDALTGVYVEAIHDDAPGWVRERARIGARQRRWAWCAGSAGVLAMSIFVTAGSAYQQFNPEFFAAIGGGLLVLAAGAIYVRWWEKREHLSMFWSSQHRTINGVAWKPLNVELGEKGMRTWGTGHESLQSWKLMMDLVETRTFVQIFRADGVGVTLVKRQMGEPEEVAAIVQRCREMIRAAGGSEDQRIARYLAKRDEACQKCKHNLRGSDGKVCPECGTPVSLRNFPDAADA